MDKNYNIFHDDYFERYVEENNLSEDTEKNYAKQLKKFCVATDTKLKDIIDKCKDQQSIETIEELSTVTEGNKKITRQRTIKFDVNGDDSLIKMYFNQFEKYCLDRGNKNITINSGRDCIKAVLRYFNVDLPDLKNLQNDTSDWNLLSKEDFKFVLADSSLMHKSLILFMLSTGFRIHDCLDISIGSYMDATSDYHDFVEVDDFIDNAPDDMMGYFDFIPHKSINNNNPTLCKIFNSPESNKFILQNLRRVKNEYLPRKSKRTHKELKLTKSDSIFGSKQHLYKKSPKTISISQMYGLKNKKLYEWHINQIKQDIKDGVISAEDYDKQVALIPKFHPHACRKYFCTMIERHTSNERRYRLMEGHAPKNKLDKSYINISKEEIKEVYDDAVNDLSVYYNDDQEIEKIRDEFNQQLNAQQEKHQSEIDALNKEHQNEISSLKKQLKETNESIKDLDQKIEQSRTLIPMHKLRDVIISYLESIDEWDSNRHTLLTLMVLEYVKRNPGEFEDTTEYLFDLVRKLDIEIELSNKDILQQTVELNQNREPEIDYKMFNFIDDLLNRITNNEGVMKRIGHIDMDKFDFIAEKYLRDSDYDLSNLSEDDRNQMAGDVLRKYMDYKD